VVPFRALPVSLTFLFSVYRCRKIQRQGRACQLPLSLSPSLSLNIDPSELQVAAHSPNTQDFHSSRASLSLSLTLSGPYRHTLFPTVYCPNMTYNSYTNRYKLSVQIYTETNEYMHMFHVDIDAYTYIYIKHTKHIHTETNKYIHTYT